jgi:AmmeMemoRadiSam system protein A
MLTDSQKRALLHLARESVVARVSRTDASLPPLPVIDAFPQATGVFVTLKRRGALRGCLGVLQMRGSLAEEVARCACDSATVDPRFPPLTPGELAEVSLEISVLGRLEPVDPGPAGGFEIGRHGLVVEQGHRRGLLLPQVAVEWGWTPEQFLRQTCRKAGLAPDAWQNGAEVFRFDADVFGE